MEARSIARGKGSRSADRDSTGVVKDVTNLQNVEIPSGKNASLKATRIQNASPSFSSPHETTTVQTNPNATPVQKPLLLTYNSNKDEAFASEPSKAIVKFSTNDDDKMKLANIEAPRVLPCVGAFTVQCALCLKWRLIPSKEKYEEIRQSVLENPFFCSSTIGWRPDASCENPSDVLQDESHLWAIDKPNIPVPPRGWERQLVIRGAGASKFADVYYVAPSGRKLRSMPEVERFMAEFPEFGRAGLKQSQFSFIIPRPLDSNYCRKKTAGSPSLGANSSENQKLSSAKKGKKSLSIKRKAFENLSSKEGSEEQASQKKKSSVITEKSEKGLGDASSYESLISQQVVKGLLPPEELTKGLTWGFNLPNSGNGDDVNASAVSQEPTTASSMRNAELQDAHTRAKIHGENPAGQALTVSSRKKQNTSTGGHSTRSERSMGVGS